MECQHLSYTLLLRELTALFQVVAASETRDPAEPEGAVRTSRVWTPSRASELLTRSSAPVVMQQDLMHAVRSSLSTMGSGGLHIEEMAQHIKGSFRAVEKNSHGRLDNWWPNDHDIA